MVINPAFPTVVYCMPNCWKLLARHRNDLLEHTCRAYGETTADAANQRDLPSLFSLLRRFLTCLCLLLFLLTECNQRQKNRASNKASCTIKGKRPHIIHPNALRHKGHTPDGCRKKKEQTTSVAVISAVTDLSAPAAFAVLIHLYVPSFPKFVFLFQSALEKSFPLFSL